MVNRDTLENFLVLEGLDGSGTTTQLGFCRQRLEQMGIRSFCTFEPTQSAIGRLLRRVLEREVAALAETVAFLFAADRHEHLHQDADGILSRHAGGEVIVCDRYLFSSLAYQSVSCDFDFVAGLNAQFPLPSHLIFIDTAVEVCRARWYERHQRDLYESVDVQKRVLDGYNRAMAIYDASPMRIHRIDGTQTIETIAEEVWKVVCMLPIMTV